MKRILLLLSFATLSITIQAQVFEWVTGSRGAPKYNTVDFAGNVITIIKFASSGTFDVDPGPAVYNLTANNSAEFYLLKLDAQGNFVWAQKTIEIYANMTLNDYYNLTTDNAGNIYFSIIVFGVNIDIDPGPSIFTVGGSGVPERYIIKLNNAGNFIYASALANPNVLDNLKTDATGNVYLTAINTTTTIADADSGPATYTIQGSYILKLDAAGNFAWAKPIGGFNSNIGGSINESSDLMIDKNNNIYVAGTYSGTADFNPGIGTYTMSAALSTGSTITLDAFITKLDNAGNFVWAKTFTGTAEERIASVFVDSLSNVYATGYFNGTTDFDPGPATII